MAFNMKRPIIKGTVLHKRSMALAKKKKSIVTPATVGADQALVQAGEWMGKSNIGEAVDFTIDQDQIDWSKVKGKDNKKKKKWTKKDTIETIAKNDQISLDEAEQRYQDSLKGDTEKTKKKDTWYRDSDNDGNVLTRTLDKIKLAIKNAKTKKEKKVLENKQEELLKIESLRIKPLPTEESEPKLTKASEYVPITTADTDRFVDAAEARGYDMSTQEGWDAAENAGKYDEEKDKWVFTGVEVGEPTEGEDAELIAIREQQARELEAKKEEKRKKQEEANKKRTLEFEKKKAEAQEFYGPDVVVTKEKYDDYFERKAAGDFDMPVIEEEDDLEPGEEGYEEQERKRFLEKDEDNDGMPDYLQIEPEFKSSDLERKQSGPIEQQINDRIWGYAKKGGLIHKNMRKRGYIPQEER